MSSLPKTILPGQTIGIIGGGQLGRMMALSAKAAGFRVAVLEPSTDSPCGQVADIEIIASYNDLEGLKQLSDVSDVITYEFENINGEALEWLQQNAYVPQGSRLLKISQNRIKEKQAIEAAGAEVAPYAIVTNVHELQESIDRIGLPCVLKTATGGYDGKGQYVLREKDDWKQAQYLLERDVCVLEKWIAFEKEISVIVARSAGGETVVFPVAENIHRENILHQTIVPARITVETEVNAFMGATQIADALGLVGTLAVEMFVMEDGSILINELAPRPHNSGHYTMDACETSQFEQHIRAICNWKLDGTELLKPVVMVNVLGEHLEGLLERIPKLDNWKIHLYGKEEVRNKRKMGHVNILRNNTDQALQESRESGIWTLERSHEAIRISEE